MTNPLLRGPVDLLRPSVHGLASSLRLVAPRSCQRISRPCNDLQCRDSGLVQRDLWKVFPISSAETSSLRFDVGGPDHLAPFLGFFGDQLAELGRRSRQRRAAEVSETGLHLRVVESRVDLLIELVDDLGRRGLRYAEAVPITPLVGRQELTHGRDVRQRVRARRSGYCERTQPASPDVLDGRRHCRKAYLYLPREEIGQSRPCATIENVHHINTSHYFEKLAGQMHC